MKEMKSQLQTLKDKLNDELINLQSKGQIQVNKLITEDPTMQAINARIDEKRKMLVDLEQINGAKKDE